MDTPHLLGFWDLIVFASYFVGIVILGVWVARHEKKTARDYFLAGDRLPWYAIGTSVLASNISTEHFIGMVGWAYTYGFVIANFEWGAWFTWSIALWFFLPFYLRTRIYTMPEFMEQRFNKTCRYILSVTSTITYVMALSGAVLFAGAKVLQVMFDLPLGWGVLVLGLATGLYTVAGGLLSVVWTEFVQCLLILFGGMTLLCLGLSRVGGLRNLMTEFPDKFMMFHTTHDKCPILAYYICSMFVGAYYVSSNQFLMQRCLGGRTHWDGRMGLLFSNYLKLLMPAIVVLPGIIAYKMFPGLPDPDQSYPLLAKELLAPGLFGLVMAAIAAAIMSTVSSAINSASTLVTMDLYVALSRHEPAETELVKVGKISSTVLLILGVMFGLLFCSPWFQDPKTGQPVAVFTLIMNIFFFIGPPLSVVFLTGIFWKRATPAAAVWTIVGGYLVTLISQGLLFTSLADLPSFLRTVLDSTPFLADLKNSIDHSYVIEHYNNFLYVAIWNGIVSLILMISISLFTTPRPSGEINHLIWRPSVMRVDPDHEGGQGRTLSLVFWWIVCMALTAGLYGYFAWFQLSQG